MAKTKRTSKVAASAKTTSGDVVVVDVQTLIIPLSILFAGLMVALALFFGLRSSNLVANNNPNNGTNTNTDGTTDPEPTFVESVSIDGDPYKGDKQKAKVAIVEFTDYECPYCKMHFENTYSQLIQNYVDNGNAIYVVRDFPLSFHDPLATKQALATQCVFAQGGADMFFKLHDRIFEVTTSNGNGMTEERLKELAGEVGANMSRFNSCYDSNEFGDEIATDLSEGSIAGISGTPGFVIGLIADDGKTVTDGVILAGAYPYADFQKVIDDLLSK